MGNTCTKTHNDVVEDKPTAKKKNVNNEKKKEREIVKNKRSDSREQEESSGSTSEDESVVSHPEGAGDGAPGVVRTIEALQHTMKPTVAVVPVTSLHPKFHQFTPVFPHRTAANVVVSCEGANASQQVLIAGEDCSIALLNYETGHVMRRWVHAHERDITSMTRPTASGLFCTGGRDKVVKVWGLRQDDPVAELEGHTLNVTSVDMHPTESLVVSGSKDNTVRLWDVNTKEELYCGDIKLNIVHFVRFVPEVNCVAQGGEDLTLRLWDIRTNAGGSNLSLSCTLEGLDYYPTCCEIIQSRPFSILTGHNGVNNCGAYVCEWDLRMQKCLRMYTGHRETVTSLKMATPSVYGSDKFFSTSQDGDVGVWSLASDPAVEEVKPDTQFQIPEGRVTSSECTREGDFIVTLSNGCLIVLKSFENEKIPSRRYRYVGVTSGKSE